MRYSLFLTVYVFGVQCFQPRVGHHLCDSRSANLVVEKEVLLDPEADPADW